MSTAELFIEIRCEELPARFAEPARTAFGTRIAKMLKGVDHGPITTYVSPRRLAVRVVDVTTVRPVEEKLVTGPPEAAAFRDGQPTPAALGFARSKGITADQLEIVDGPKGRVVGARIQTGGERTADLVAQQLEDVVLGIPFPKSMRWGNGDFRWGRPLHGVSVILDGEPIETSVAGIESGSETLGHRRTPGPISVRGAEQWLADLRDHNVEADPAVRHASIQQQLLEAAQRLGAETPEIPDLLDEVAHLVEWPVVIESSFDAELLELPPRLLVESMKVHQRVFPLFRNGELINRFLVVTNHPFATDPEVAAIIAKGNENVLAARFHDAKFFYAEDQKHTLAEHAGDLSDMRWIRGGGTMVDKADRIATLAAVLAPLFDADPDIARTAGALSKADLATQMVGEFPELQGHVGRLLAGLQGQPESVAIAIEEHYQPRFSSDDLPASPAGRATALADRIDTLTGCFSLGLKPKGSADPLGLRRAANGVISILIDAQTRTTLDDLFSHSEFDAPEGGWTALMDFVTARLRAQLQDRWPTDVVDAILATGDRDPVALYARGNAMVSLANTAEFGPLKTTFKRVMGLTREHDSTAYQPDALVDAAEHTLHEALVSVRSRARELGDALDYAGALAELSTLKAPVDTLFEAVLVMHDDPEIRANRLGLLRSVADEFGRIADFTHLSADGATADPTKGAE